jgi:hypothetical protein
MGENMKLVWPELSTELATVKTFDALVVQVQNGHLFLWSQCVSYCCGEQSDKYKKPVAWTLLFF